MARAALAERGIDTKQFTHRVTPDVVQIPNARRFTLADGAEAVSQLSPALHIPVFDASTRRLEKPKSEYFFSKDWLKNEVNNLQKDPIPEREVPWYYLSGTGFWVKEQVTNLIQHVHEAGRDAFPGSLELELAKTKVDIEAFEQEYLKQMLTLKWNIAWGDNGQLIATDYGNVSLRSTTGKEEREGVVWEALFGDEEKGTTGAEGWLRTAPADSFAIVVSPAGWTNLFTKKGEAINHKENQIYALRTKEDGTLDSLTFRIEATPEQIEAFQRDLGRTIPKTYNSRDRIKQIQLNVACLTPEDASKLENPVNSFNDLIDLMQKAVGDRPDAYQGKSFDEMRIFLQDPKKFTHGHPLTPLLIDRLQGFVRDEFATAQSAEDLTRRLEIAHAITILHQNKMYREEEEEEERTGKKRENNERGMRSRDVLLNEGHSAGGMDYLEEQRKLKQRPGCGGGGTTTSMGSSRLGEIDKSSSKDGQCVTCPFCKTLVDAIVTESKIECPSCHKTADK